ncbi:MAG: hypothetical protein HQK52_00880 [Oligoflexia bacterium]|nr:hypothetical protein [Oligoflexia bacterium]
MEYFNWIFYKILITIFILFICDTTMLTIEHLLVHQKTSGLWALVRNNFLYRNYKNLSILKKNKRYEMIIMFVVVLLMILSSSLMLPVEGSFIFDFANEKKYALDNVSIIVFAAVVIAFFKVIMELATHRNPKGQKRLVFLTLSATIIQILVLGIVTNYYSNTSWDKILNYQSNPMQWGVWYTPIGFLLFVFSGIMMISFGHKNYYERYFWNKDYFFNVNLFLEINRLMGFYHLLIATFLFLGGSKEAVYLSNIIQVESQQLTYLLIAIFVVCAKVAAMVIVLSLLKQSLFPVNFYHIERLNYYVMFPLASIMLVMAILKIH